MKAIISMFIGCIIILTSTLASASPVNYDWENDLDVYMNYDQSSGIIKVTATIPSQTNETNQFSLGLLYIDGREYREYFHYNKTGKYLFIDFEIPESITTSTDLVLSIRDIRYNIIYSANIYDYNPSSSTPISVVEVVNIASLSRAEVISMIQKGDYSLDDVPEIKKAIIKYNITAEDIYTGVTTVTTNTQAGTGAYIPKYNSQASEPSVINGIGNNSSYNSWRVSY